MKKIELNILIFLLTEALFLIYGIKINIINIVIGTIIGLIFILLFNKSRKNNIIKYILLIVSFFFFFNTVFNISSFIINNYLNNYSYIFIIISVLLISYLLIKNNYHSYIRSVEIIFYFFLIIKLLSFFLVIPNINIENINYSLMDELKININSLYIGLIILFIHESIFYLTNNKVNNSIYIFSSLNSIIIKTLCILVMGKTLFYLYDYPYINILKRIKYLDFIERMEGILSFEYLFSFIVLSAYFLIIIKCFIYKKKS